MMNILFFLCLAFFTTLSPCRAELVDRVVAIINDDVITLSEIEEEGRTLFQQLARQSDSTALGQRLQQAREEILASLIDKVLVEQRAAEQGITVEEGEIEDSLERMIAASGLDRDAFREQLIHQRSNIDHLREQIKWQILEAKLISLEIRSKVVITEEKIHQYYQQQYAAGNAAEGYHLLQIGCRYSDAPGSREQAVNKVTAAHRLAQGGKSFKELAQTFSELPSAVDGGDIGVFKEEEMATYMRQAVLSLAPGDITPVLEGPDKTLQFFMLQSKKIGDVVEQAPFDRVKDDILQHLQEQETQRQFRQWLDDLRAQAYIKKIL